MNTSVIVKRGNAGVSGALTFQAGNVMQFRTPEPLQPGRYQVQIVGSQPGGILSLPSAAAPPQELDADPRPTWPTGDRQPGGDLGFRFVVA